MEEASSVIKAIEKGWIAAGKPQEFSVKVYEEATKNFLGLTSKPAKIAIFFDEKAAHPQAKQHRPIQQQQPRRPSAQQEGGRGQRAPYSEHAEPRRAPAQQRHERPQPQQRPLQQAQPQEATQNQERRQKEVWTPEMIDAVNGWLKESLSLMGVVNQSFNTDAKNYYLKINFEQPLFEDREKERTVFRSFAHLLMQSLRNKFKKGLRGFKVILNSPAQ